MQNALRSLTRRSILAGAGAGSMTLAMPALVRAAGPAKLRIGYQAFVDSVPYWMASDKGYFTQEGISVEWLPTPVPAMVPGVVTNSVEVALLNTIQAIQPIDAGLPITLISGAYVLPSVGNLGLARRVGSNLLKPEQLVGKRLGVASLASIMLYMFNYWYDQHGLNSKSLKWIEADGPTQREMFRRGELDASLAYDPWFSVMKEDGTAENFIDFYAETPAGTMVTGAIAQNEWAAANPEVLAAFRRAVVKGVEAAKDHAEAKATLKKWAKLSDDVAKRLEIPTYSAEIKPENLAHVFAVMKHQGLVTRELAFRDVAYPWKV